MAGSVFDKVVEIFSGAVGEPDKTGESYTAIADDDYLSQVVSEGLQPKTVSDPHQDKSYDLLGI